MPPAPNWKAGHDVSFHKATTLAEHYDQGLHLARHHKLPEGYPAPQPSACWPKENIALYEKYRDWLLSGGTCEHATHNIYLPIAGHVFGLNLKPHWELDLEQDLERALDYTRAKQSGKDWIKACRNGLNKFRRFLRLERGLGEEYKSRPSIQPASLPACRSGWCRNWIAFNASNRGNWREARIEENIRRFWSGYLRMWRFFVEERQVLEVVDLKRQHVLDYVDKRLDEGYSITGVNKDLRDLRSFLFFLLDEGYTCRSRFCVFHV